MRLVHGRLGLRVMLAASTAIVGGTAITGSASAQGFTPGNLLVSSSTYEGMAATITVGQALPGGGNAVANGSYPNVFKNATPDAGFPTTPARSTAATFTPFGLFFANASTLYVSDEGLNSYAASRGTGTISAIDLTTALSDPMAGLQKWVLKNGVWTLAYTLQTGLGLGVVYDVAGTTDGGDTGTMQVATDGLRNLAGRVSADGTVSLFATTSTISGSGDDGADPNRLVEITDVLANADMTFAATEQFNTLQTSAYGQVLRGVAFTPVPEPASMSVFAVAMGGLAALRRRRR